MVNSLDQNIRGAMEQRLATVPNIPHIVYEADKKYTPVVGVPFVEPTVVHAAERPSTLGDDHIVLHEGLFIVVLVYPSGKGVGLAESMANAVKEKFRASADVTLNGTTVRFMYAERRPILHEPDWFRIPIEISWYLYDTSY